MRAVVLDINVDHIDPSRRTPRSGSSEVQDLAQSMREHGLLQPIVVRAHPTVAGRYEVVAGHRRLAAAQALGWRRIPAIVRVAGSDEAYLLTVVENLQRQDLGPREEWEALALLVRERSWSTRRVASAVKRSQSYVSRRLRVFEDPVVGPLVLQGRLNVSAAEELLPLSPSRKRRLALRAVEQRWDRARVRRAIQEVGSARAPRRSAGLLARTRAFREALRTADAGRLTESERRELRLAFQELATLAKAPKPRDEGTIVYPTLPRTARTRGR
jgi:ParB family chromosome partitioning protein